MEKKDLITVRDYSYDLEDVELGYYRPQCVSAKDYVDGVVRELKGRKETVSSFMTVEQFTKELRASQYTKEELSAKERVEAYMSKPNNDSIQRFAF